MGVSTVCFGQAPVNDNFADRIELAGSSVSFTGTLAGATLEPGEGCYPPSYFCPPGQSSVWWSWIAPASAQVVLFSSEYDPSLIAGLEVLTGTNVTQLTSVGYNAIDLITNRYTSFLATAGTTYSIRLKGANVGSYAFRLIMTNSPWIFTHPQTRTVSTNEPALFTVVAGGLKPLTYQWRHAGTNLPGETAVALAVLATAPEQAGAYSVVVSNSTGASESLAAQLYVSQSLVRPYLTMLGPVADGRLVFALTGETGRSYRIETSTDLVSWTSEDSFSANRYCCTSVVINSNTTSVYSVPVGSTTKFLRAAHYPAVHKYCALYLQHIWFANAEFARQSPKHFLATVSEADIMSYFKDGFCYGNYDHGHIFADTYAISTVIGPPQCMISPNTDRLEGPD